MLDRTTKQPKLYSDIIMYRSKSQRAVMKNRKQKVSTAKPNKIRV